MLLAANFGHDHPGWIISWNGGIQATIKYLALPGAALSWNLKASGNQNFQNCKFCPGRLQGCIGDHVITTKHIKNVRNSATGGDYFNGSVASDPLWTQWAEYPTGWHGFHHLSGFYCRVENTPPPPFAAPGDRQAASPPPPPLELALI